MYVPIPSVEAVTRKSLPPACNAQWLMIRYVMPTDVISDSLSALGLRGVSRPEDNNCNRRDNVTSGLCGITWFVPTPGRGKLNPGPGVGGVHGPAWTCQKAPITSQRWLTPSLDVGAGLAHWLLPRTDANVNMMRRVQVHAHSALDLLPLPRFRGSDKECKASQPQSQRNPSHCVVTSLCVIRRAVSPLHTPPLHQYEEPASRRRGLMACPKLQQPGD